jgi:hypothetical protein
VALYRVPERGLTYHRTTFLARPLAPVPDAVIDPDIHAVHWLDYASLQAISGKLRSPLVLAAIERHRAGICYPLDIIETP